MPNTTIGEYYRNRGGHRTLTGHPLVQGTSCVGVEVELEGLPTAFFQSDYWDVKHDGSLRNNGREFVFRGPTGGKDLYNAVVELDSFLFDKNPDGNWRCSTHVHVDVRDMTVAQIKNLIIAYLMYEKFLFRLSGMHRYNNNFCCAIGFAQQQLQVLSEAWDRPDISGFFDRVLIGWDKYSALNLLPVSGFGSVEFRLSEALWRKGKLLLLCNRYLALKELAKNWDGSQRELIAYLSKASPREVLGKGCPREIPAEFKEDISTGIKLCHDLVTFSEFKLKRNYPPPHPHVMVVNARNSGAAAGRERVPLEIFNDGSPGLPLLPPNVRRWCRDTAQHGGFFLSDSLVRVMNYSGLRFLSQLSGLHARALLDRETLELYEQWLEDGRPVVQREDAVNMDQVLAGFGGPRIFNPAADAVFEIENEEDDDDDDDDHDEDEW